MTFECEVWISENAVLQPRDFMSDMLDKTLDTENRRCWPQ